MVQGSVKILFYNENAESIVASAGRISTTKGSANEIYNKSCDKNREKNIALINKIISSGHTSVLEHIFFNLSFDNVSVFVEQFMIEFRLASFTVKSRRYVDFGNMGYVTPDFNGYGQKAINIQGVYQQHMEYLFNEYNYFLNQGIPKEDARFVLPYSFRSNFYCTMNARELINVVNEMVYGRGKEYAEIVALGKSLVKQCEKELPFLNFGEYVSAEESFNMSDLKYVVEQAETETNSEKLVELLNATDKPENVICRAALLQQGIYNWKLLDIKDSDVQKRIIKNIFSNSRKRELEQVNFTILFKKISLSGITHLVRHRMQSIIIPKYVDICDFDKYIIPDSVVKLELQDRYTTVFKNSKKIAEELQNRGLKNSDRAYLLLSGMTLPIITTMNGNELFTFIRLRSCNRSQWEISDNTKALLRILREKYPILFSLYGPTCYMTGRCPEGKMTCGQIDKVKNEFTMDKDEDFKI